MKRNDIDGTQVILPLPMQPPSMKTMEPSTGKPMEVTWLKSRELDHCQRLQDITYGYTYIIYNVYMFFVHTYMIYDIFNLIYHIQYVYMFARSYTHFLL